MEKRILLSAIVLLVFASLTVRTEVKSGKKGKGSNKKEIPPLTIPAPEKYLGNPCISMETCKECITAHPECAWCAKQDMNYTADGKARCNYRTQIINECGDTDTVYISDVIETIANNELSDTGVTENEATQIKPQRIKLSLKPKSPFDLKIEYRQAVDYPVDLYYLMDLSKSMEDDKDKLASLGDLLADRMEKITKNFRLGFGSFVDKVVMPYVSTAPDKIQEPCPGCAAPYGFRNHMSLSLNTSQFAKEVNNARVSGNLDAPEGGFDAIMQAIVCKQEIGWREKSRKMLMFSTDSGFHYAGDGKLGGIVKPNDGECHLNTKGEYTESSNQDYPSLSQINQKSQEHKVNIIFAVTEKEVPIYTKLSEQLEGSSTGKLADDSSNIVQLVQDQYDKITSSVMLKDNATDNVRITYYSSCLGDKAKEKTNICKGLKVGMNVTFEAKIEVVSCPENRDEWNQTIQIYPVGLNESLIIDLHMICECDCEKPWNQERNSPKCSSGNGTYQCGVCSCYDQRYGKECECDGKSEDTADDKACIAPNDTKVCSGRGTCRCGICECFNKTSVKGPFCECDSYSCDRSNGLICGGEDHGTCECGECKCKTGWTGQACDCMTDTKPCISPFNGEICHGHGECVCGRCKCPEENGNFRSGTFCEDCPACRDDRCQEYKECVQCTVFHSGPLSQEEGYCHTNCSNYTIIEVDKAEVKENDEHLCSYKDDDDCRFYFVYKFNESSNSLIEVRAQRTKDCPEELNILAIILGVVLGIVLIGLALLFIWKLLTTIHDRREFAKFEKERQMARWDTGENPIYKQATSTFNNPTYGGK